MKVKRQKHVRKALTFYKNYFGFRPPYHVLADGTFCKAALTFQINIRDQLPKYLDAEVKLCTTKCVITECESLGSILYGPLKILEQYERVDCGHDSPITAAFCMKKSAKKATKRKYFVATQDRELSEEIRKKSGIPLLYISHNAITLEAPSDKSKSVAEECLSDKMAPATHELSHLSALKTSLLGGETVIKKKRKTKGGPNPLSCKKKKAASILNSGKIAKRKRHKRKQNTSSL